MIGEVSRRTGLSEPTLRYYERIGLIDPVPRHSRSGHRDYSARMVDDLAWLGCLRATGMSVGEMRRYRQQLARRESRSQRELLERHAGRVREQLDQTRARLDYVEAKARLWAAREQNDRAAEARAEAELRNWSVEP